MPTTHAGRLFWSQTRPEQSEQFWLPPASLQGGHAFCRRGAVTHFEFRSIRILCVDMGSYGIAVKQRARLETKLLYNYEEWLEIANSSPFSFGVIWHHCGPWCKCTGISHTRQRFVKSLKKMMFSCLPRAPSADEWTSQSPMPNWVTFLSLNNNILDEVLQVAFAKGGHSF